MDDDSFDLYSDVVEECCLYWSLVLRMVRRWSAVTETIVSYQSLEKLWLGGGPKRNQQSSHTKRQYDLALERALHEWAVLHDPCRLRTLDIPRSIFSL